MISVPEAGLLPRTPRPVRCRELLDHLGREAVRIRRQRHGRDDAHQLPVAGRRVLALRALDEPAGDRGRVLLGRAALELPDVAEAELLQVGEVEAADGPGDVGKRVRALVAVLRRVRQLARPNRVQHDHAGARHGAILRSVMDTVLGLLGIVVWIVAVIAFAAAVTYVVIKVIPGGDEELKPKSETVGLAGSRVLPGPRAQHLGPRSLGGSRPRLRGHAQDGVERRVDRRRQLDVRTALLVRMERAGRDAVGPPERVARARRTRARSTRPSAGSGRSSLRKVIDAPDRRS